MTNKNRDPEHWAQFANLLLLAYIRRRLGASPGAWGPVPNPIAMHTVQADCTRLAVIEKNAWAQAMADGAELPDAAFLRASWEATLQRAEEKIAAYVASLA